MLDWLFDTSRFVTRGHCGPGWSPDLIRLAIFANEAITLAYLLIPIGILWGLRLFRSELGRTARVVAALFVWFIISCGLGHYFDSVLVFRLPVYRFVVAWDCQTAVASWVTAAVGAYSLGHVQRFFVRQSANNDRLEELLAQERERSRYLDDVITRYVKDGTDAASSDVEAVAGIIADIRALSRSRHGDLHA